MNSSAISAKLVHEVMDAYLLSVCPTGRRMCLYFTRHPQDSFAFEGGKWTRNRNGAGLDETVRIIEIGSSWRSAYSIQPRQKVYRSSFFADGGHVYVETSPFPSGGQLVSQQLIVDIQSGKQEEELRTERQSESGVYHFALNDRTLLGTEFSRNPTRYTALNLSISPGYKRIVRVPFAITPERDPLGHDTGVFISADRTKLVYSTDRSIVYRRSEDLGLVWTREIDRNYFGAPRLAISSDGSWVAAAVIDTTFIEQQRRYYVEVYVGATGVAICRLPLKGDAGIAISPNGKYLAVGERTDPTAQTKETRLSVSIFDIASGQRVARIVHDRFRVAHGEWVNSHFGIEGIQFTSDGKYLITSSVRTKIWELEPMVGS